MQMNDLWNLLSCHGPNETVTIDATGLKIGRHGHIDVPLDASLRQGEYEVVKLSPGNYAAQRVDP